MTLLGNALARRAPDDPLWREGSAWRTVVEVQSAAASLAATMPRGRVALAFHDDSALATALLAAEGHCEAILLVPASWDQTTLDRYLPLARIDQLVTDRPDLTAPPASGRPRRRRLAPTSWIIPTSGTTSEPKLVKHTLASLTRSARTDVSKGREFVWGLVYELARFAGLQVFLQAILGGSRLVFTPDRNEPERLVAALADAGCNALSATPTLWRRLMMTAQADRLPLRRITLGGESADQAILTHLTTRFPAARIIHIYASTEAGVGFSVGDGLAGFPSRFLEKPPPNAAVRIDREGRLWLRPATTNQRYLGTNYALTNREGWINTGDLVRREGDRVHFLGRANGAINVGGNKVFPEEIETCIRTVPGVRHVTIRARANPIMGSLVEARVEPDPTADRSSLRHAILQTCRASLAPFKVPALIQWVDAVPVSPTGKLLRV